MGPSGRFQIGAFEEDDAAPLTQWGMRSLFFIEEVSAAEALTFCGRVGAARAIRKSNLLLRVGFSDERCGKE